MTGSTPDENIHLVRGGDLSCARLLVLLHKQIQPLPAGTTVHLETSDPVAAIDLPAWCRLTGHEYLGRVVDTRCDAMPKFALIRSRSPRRTHADRPWKIAGPESG